MLAYVNRVAFDLFGLPIYWYAIIIVSGIAIGLFLANRESLRVGLKEDDISNYLLWALPLSIIGARLYYVLFDLKPYLADPTQVFNIRNGGLAIYGGLIAALAVLLIYTRRHFIDPWQFLDVCAPSVILAQAIGRWGNFMNHEAFGGETTKAFLTKLHLPNFIIQNMYIEGSYHQPTFFYESSWNVIGFLLLIFLRKYTKIFKQGEVFLGYIIWYSFGRFFIEGMRTDSLYLFANIRVSQLLSAILFIGGIGLVWYRRKLNVKDYERSFGKNEALL